MVILEIVHAALFETKLWGTLIILFIVGLLYLANKLTKGTAIGYINYEMSDRSKKNLIIIHGLSSLILALALPNNYLNEIDFIKTLYEENQLWIAGSIVILLLSFLILIGTVLTLITRQAGVNRSAKRDSIRRILNL